jgi:hypothetical protein
MLHYAQLQCPAKLYPSETLMSSSASTPHPAIIKDDEAGTVDDVSVGAALNARRCRLIRGLLHLQLPP